MCYFGGKDNGALARYGSYVLPAAMTTELGSRVFQSRPSLEHRSWLSLEPATAETSFSTFRITDGSTLTCTFHIDANGLTL